MDEIILQKNIKLSVEEKARKNIDSEVDENYLYNIDNISLDEKKELRKRAFESEIENIYDTKSHNSMTFMYGNEVHKTDEWNLLYDILNPSE